MTNSTEPIHLDPALMASAQSSAESMGRTVSQQIAHWARVGRELERCPELTASSIQAVIEGRGNYDALNSLEQVMARADWSERIDAARRNLRLDLILAAQGREVVELDQQGKLVVRSAESSERERVEK